MRYHAPYAFYFITSSLVPSLRTHVRKQNHVAYRRAVGEQHHETVDADARAAGRRQAVFEGADVIGVEVHRLDVAGFLLPHLLAETLGLVVGVVELRESVGELAAGDVELEALGNLGVRVIAAGIPGSLAQE